MSNGKKVPTLGGGGGSPKQKGTGPTTAEPTTKSPASTSEPTTPEPAKGPVSDKKSETTSPTQKTETSITPQPTTTVPTVADRGGGAIGVYDKLKQYFQGLLSYAGTGYRNVREWFLSLSPKQRWALIAGAVAALGVSGYSIIAYLRDEEGVPERSIPRFGEKDDEKDDEDLKTPNINDPRDPYFDERTAYDDRGGRGLDRATIICCDRCHHKEHEQHMIRVGRANVAFEVYIRPVFVNQESQRDLKKNSLFT